MASVVFLRGANVGGHNKFQPSVLAKQLDGLGVVNVGAAGTFVVREKIAEAKLRLEILKRLSFKPEMAVCSGQDILSLAQEDPFKQEKPNEEVRAFFSALTKSPPIRPVLPLYAPDKAAWEVKVVRASGHLVLSLWWRRGVRILYPSEVVEKAFSAPATTRNWNTLVKICQILQK
jgi:uncharacterized protein (DUF1697 family)